MKAPRSAFGSMFLCALMLLHAAAAPPAPPRVSWSTLKTLTSSAAASPARALDRRTIAVPGFMVPLEDDAEQVTEFLLVPFAGACIHVPPPPPNQMVYVKLRGGRKVK